MEKVIGMIVVGLLIVAAVALIMALPVMLLWNAIIPDIFHLSSIDFWQALALTALCSILFKSTSNSSK